MANVKEPLLYNGDPPDEWFDWLQDHYYGLDLEGKQVPHYVLIIGEPNQVPFRFQSILDTVASVGRIAFDTLDDLTTYVNKLIRIETASEPLVTKEAIFFATDGDMEDPTYYSRKYMAEPLAKSVQDELGFATRAILGDDAKKMSLKAALSTGSPALVYTASHGLLAAGQTNDVQKRYNGAICCQHTGEFTLDSLFSADDVPLHEPFLEGAVFFQFACFGYGTPTESDYSHWIDGVPEKYTDSDFVAALPKRLLAHPRGPIAFVGHLDSAWLHGFADAEAPDILDRWHTRIEPFKEAVDQLLGAQPSGLAMSDMNKRYGVCNALITNTYDRERRGRLTWTPELEKRFLDNWIVRSDAQNYMIFGDPAARLRIST
ncbi:MAG: C25 family cysteine peptidase [Halobacteriota archaeon]